MRLLFGLSILVACGLQNAVSAAQPDASTPRASVSTSDSSKNQRSDYVLQPQDLIKVSVYNEPSINAMGEVRLSQDSVVTLPLIDRVDLKGLTVAQATARITKLYGDDYLVNPSVNILVTDYYKRKVQVMGQVGNPGLVTLPPEEDFTLLNAINAAGSFTRLSSKKVTIRRIMSDGKAKVWTVDLDKTVQGKNQDEWLEPDDVINVPERML